MTIEKQPELEARWERFDKQIHLVYVGEEHPVAWVDYDDVDPAEAEALAHILASAPRLLEALQEIRQSLIERSDGDPYEEDDALDFDDYALLETIDAAISSALGEDNV